MSTRKTLTTALTAAALVTGISLAWAQTEDQAPQADATTTVVPMPSEQTPADPNVVPPQTAPTNPPAVDGTTPAPMSSDANSQAPLTTTATTSRTGDNGMTVTPSPDAGTSPIVEPAPRADRN